MACQWKYKWMRINEEMGQVANGVNGVVVVVVVVDKCSLIVFARDSKVVVQIQSSLFSDEHILNVDST